MQPVQRPEIVGMLAGAAQLAVKAEIGAVHRLGFVDFDTAKTWNVRHVTG